MPILLYSLASAAVVAAAVAMIVLRSGWEAAAAAVVMVAGTAWLGRVIALLVMGEGALGSRGARRA
jgi:hypothetical protein